jgi:hypothetical protein
MLSHVSVSSLFAACEEPSASSDDVSILIKRQFCAKALRSRSRMRARRAFRASRKGNPQLHKTGPRPFLPIGGLPSRSIEPNDYLLWETAKPSVVKSSTYS